LYKKRHDIIMERIMNVKDEIDLNIFIKFSEWGSLKARSFLNLGEK
jgi:hypothetical protein